MRDILITLQKQIDALRAERDALAIDMTLHPRGMEFHAGDRYDRYALIQRQLRVAEVAVAAVRADEVGA